MQTMTEAKPRWTTPGVPHSGWKCVDVEDTEEAEDKCEMCGNESIRYVHVMSHPDYPKRLQVGCVCAGHMEGDALKAKMRDGRLRGRSEKRLKFILSPLWRSTRNGGERIKRVGGTHVIYRTKSGTFGHCTMSDIPGVGAQSFSKRTYDCTRDAKEALFNELYPLREVLDA
jgi:hypothetical protein